MVWKRETQRSNDDCIDNWIWPEGGSLVLIKSGVGSSCLFYTFIGHNLGIFLGNSLALAVTIRKNIMAEIF